MALFEHCIGQGWIVDGTISRSLTQAESLWRLREDISETIAQFTPYKNDIAVRVSAVPRFLKDVDSLVREQYPEFEIIWFGHIGDGNLHLFVTPRPGGTASKTDRKAVDECVYAPLGRYGGAITAEHGNGREKRDYLPISRTDAEIDLMRRMKRLLDPDLILNPGLVVKT